MDSMAEFDETCPLAEGDFAAVASIQAHILEDCPRCLLLYTIARSVTDAADIYIQDAIQAYGTSLLVIREGRDNEDYKVWDLFAAADSPKLVPDLQHRVLVGDFSLRESLVRAKTWMSDCVNGHDTCKPSLAGSLPKRVLDVAGNTVRLVETDGQSEDYLALSHCWGDSRPPCLTVQATLARNMREIPWETMPNTFRHAIEVTRDLGFRYVWIDCICIIQDDADDWRVEASKMASIYQNAYLTLCAASARSDDGGLWPAEAVAFSQAVHIEHAGMTYTVYYRHRDNTSAAHFSWVGESEWSTVKEFCPVVSRGWTFQERLLSPRLLYFSQGEILWECGERTACECCFHEEDGSSRYMAQTRVLGDILRQMVQSPSQEAIARYWHRLVSFYSQLDLTFGKDVLPALSGLAKVCAAVRPGDTYLAGLWRGGLVEELCWAVRDYDGKSKRPEVWRAPTWSWAAVRQRVWYPKDDSVQTYTRVVSAWTELAGPDPTGEVTAGAVVLRGPAREGVIVTGPGATFDVAVGPLTLTCRSDSPPDATVSFGGDTKVLCLRVKTAGPDTLREDFILVLLEKEEVERSYRRVGMATPSTKESEECWLGEECREMEITVV
ncbi:hypothetical protein S7711_03498 [Stachybotrys chartarum IBT 7711]|uniref:Heterokaryon incompatibility domain-containing protein n=1 Tax=Stachybotrys chartarum (strain CBS 109288 / IBT 7711) TaxID=1280523 RepID=A0A084AFY0_STACB|nr:hypothetical protein S7711_03498 [Stachybotrys chartarum IBT 7711]KFA77414.1 hypothetical protein S40288_03118 [Stachybotrys chartarum IBT 40288]